MLDFIKANNIEYVILSKNATIPNTLSGLVSHSVTDPVSGETFVVLK